MATTFSGFLVDLMRLIDGDEASPTDLPIATLQQIIELGERRIYKEVRSRYNEKAFSAFVTPVVVTNNLAPIPSDFESASVVHFGNLPLLPVSENFILEYNDNATTGEAIYFAEAGANFTFAPQVASATALQGRYFYRLPALDVATAPTNALFLAEYDLFVYAALVEGAPIFKRFAEVPVWEAKYRAVRDRVNKRRESAAYSAGRMQVRPSTRLMR